VQAAVDVVSPELVLVSPPEAAARARRLLPDPVRIEMPTPVVPAAPRRGFTLFYAASVAGTIGPLVLAVLAR
jgi:hypothetical protein